MTQISTKKCYRMTRTKWGTNHEYVDKSKGLRPFHVHYAPLKGIDLERIAKKKEAGLHKETSPHHHDVGHRKRNPLPIDMG